MSKDTDIQELLGTDTKKASKKTAAAPAKTAAPAKKAAAKAKAEAAAPTKKPAAKKPAAKAEAAAPRQREPIVFEEGERDDIAAKVKKAVKKPISSKELATKIDVPTRKLRAVLYSMAKKELVSLTLEASRTAGMTVSPA